MLVVMIAGCGGSSKHAPKQTTTHPATTHPGTTRSGTTTATNGSHPIVTVNDTATAGSANGPEPLRVTIYDLRRQGPFVVLDFGVECLIPAQACITANALTPTIHADPGYPEGFRLLDPAGEKEYFPVMDGQGNYDSSQLPDPIFDSDLRLAWAKFPAPPQSVRSLDVLFPRGGPQVPGVPISDTASGPGAAQLGTGVVAATPQQFAYPPDSTQTAGLTMQVETPTQIVGSPSGSDKESATHSLLTLNTDVLFHFDKSNLTPRARTIISQVAGKIKARAVGPVQVTGYTDSIGTDAVNIPLSQARAASVVAALRPLTPGIVYQSAGLGSADPVAPNTQPGGADNPAGRALNRRVTISFRAKAPAQPTAPPTSTPQPQPGSSARTVNYSVYEGTGSPPDTYQVTVNSLVRDGNYLVLHLTIGCQGGQDNQCDVGFDFGGSATVPPIPVNTNAGGSTVAADTVSAVYLQDPNSGAEYIPLRTPQDWPVVSSVNAAIPHGETVQSWAYYPAPSPSTARMTVVLPAGPRRISDVPISSTP